MSSLSAIAAVLTVIAITPGPNNFIVLRAAAGRVRDAVPAIAGIVGGGLLVLALVGSGLGAAFAAMPRLRDAAGVVAASYLAWLGARLMLARTQEASDAALPRQWLALVAFQLVNPKTWIMMFALVAAAHGLHWVRLVPLVVAIPTLCLLAWALFGNVFARRLRHPVAARRCDRLLGLLLVLGAVPLLFR